MVTLAEDESPERPPAEGWLRLVVGGHERAALRRLVLWVTLMGALALVGLTAVSVNPLAFVVALVVTGLLFGTDSLV
jgi:hypothetical protein